MRYRQDELREQAVPLEGGYYPGSPDLCKPIPPARAKCCAG